MDKDRLSWRVEMSEPGLLQDMGIHPTPRRRPGVGEVEVEVQAVGLNFAEVMKALGVYPDLGGEKVQAPGHPITFDGDVAGRVTALGKEVEDVQIGDAVVGYGPSVFSTYAIVPTFAIAPMPGHLTWEEAATIPTVFMTAYYALCLRGHIGEGERVLVHSAAGGVGLAAVQLCRQVGAEVLATAGSPEKRRFLRSLGIDHVFDSRTLDFADEIMACTHGEGVDVVLNSLAGPFIAKGISVLRRFGRFLEIGKRDIYANEKLALFPFRNNLSFLAMDLTQLAPISLRALLREVMAGFKSRDFEPLPYRAFPFAEVASAFRLMRKSKHIGKVVVSLEGQTNGA